MNDRYLPKPASEESEATPSYRPKPALQRALDENKPEPMAEEAAKAFERGIKLPDYTRCHWLQPNAVKPQQSVNQQSTPDSGRAIGWWITESKNCYLMRWWNGFDWSNNTYTTRSKNYRADDVDRLAKKNEPHLNRNHISWQCYVFRLATPEEIGEPAAEWLINDAAESARSAWSAWLAIIRAIVPVGGAS